MFLRIPRESPFRPILVIFSMFWINPWFYQRQGHSIWRTHLCVKLAFTSESLGSNSSGIMDKFFFRNWMFWGLWKKAIIYYKILKESPIYMVFDKFWNKNRRLWNVKKGGHKYQKRAQSIWFSINFGIEMNKSGILMNKWMFGEIGVKNGPWGP